jgi:nucleoside 2-deoxyribosyltransferase
MSDIKVGEASKKKTKVYISGPMTGLPNFNRKAFAEAEEWCRKQGMSPFNPGWLKFEEDTAFAYDEILQIDIAALSLCDMILLLPGYEASNGARVELELALRLGLQVEYFGK